MQTDINILLSEAFNITVPPPAGTANPQAEAADGEAQDPSMAFHTCIADCLSLKVILNPEPGTDLSSMVNTRPEMMEEMIGKEASNTKELLQGQYPVTEITEKPEKPEKPENLINTLLNEHNRNIPIQNQANDLLANLVALFMREQNSPASDLPADSTQTTTTTNTAPDAPEQKNNAPLPDPQVGKPVIPDELTKPTDGDTAPINNNNKKTPEPTSEAENKPPQQQTQDAGQKSGNNNQGIIPNPSLHETQGTTFAKTETTTRHPNVSPNTPDATIPGGQTTAKVEHTGTGTPVRPEAIVEEITYRPPTTDKNVQTPQGPAIPIEKLIELQNTTRPTPLPTAEEARLASMNDAKAPRAELSGIDLLNSLQKAINNNSTKENAQSTTPTPLATTEEHDPKHTTTTTPPNDKHIASTTNNNRPLSQPNQLHQEVPAPEPRITEKGATAQTTVASNITAEGTDDSTNEAKDKTRPTLTTTPQQNTNNTNNTKPQTVPDQTAMKQDTPTEHTTNKEHTKNTQTQNTANGSEAQQSRQHDVTRQTTPTPPRDTKVSSTNTQTAAGGHTGLQAETNANSSDTESDHSSRQNSDKQAEAPRTDTERTRKERSPQNAPFPPQEPKVADLQPQNTNIKPDGHNNNANTNLASNEPNTNANPSQPEGPAATQSAKDTPKAENPQQLREPFNYQNMMEQIAQKARANIREGRWDMNLRLDPPELGGIKLKFSVKGDRLEARIEVEKLHVMHAIEKDIPRLRESLSAAGLDVGKFDVYYNEGQDGQQRSYFAQHTNPDGAQGPREEEMEETADGETAENADNGGVATAGVNNATDSGRIDYIA